MFSRVKVRGSTDSILRSCTGGRRFQWTSKPSVGSSGGIIVCWDSSILNKVDSFIREFSLSILFQDRTSDVTWTLTSVYGPCDESRKIGFLAEIESLNCWWNNRWCICGDVNFIRFPHEKTGVTRFTPFMSKFSDCISSLDLVDLPLSGAEFTWSNRQERPISTE